MELSPGSIAMSLVITLGSRTASSPNVPVQKGKRNMLGGSALLAKNRGRFSGRQANPYSPPLNMDVKIYPPPPRLIFF